MLTKQQIHDALQGYYNAHYGECGADEWHEQPAVNVWLFERSGKLVALKCHIITGTVTERIYG